jgi:hypothetical protein
MIKKLALGAIAALLLPLVGCMPNKYIIHSPADEQERISNEEEPTPELEEPSALEQFTETLEQVVIPERYSSSNYDTAVAEIFRQGGVANYVQNFGAKFILKYSEDNPGALASSTFVIDPEQRSIYWVPAGASEKQTPPTTVKKQIYRNLRELIEKYAKFEDNNKKYGIATACFDQDNVDQDNLNHLIHFSLGLSTPIEMGNINSAECRTNLGRINRNLKKNDENGLNLSSGDVIVFRESGVMFENSDFYLRNNDQVGYHPMMDPTY